MDRQQDRHTHRQTDVLITTLLLYQGQSNNLIYNAHSVKETRKSQIRDTDSYQVDRDGLYQ